LLYTTASVKLKKFPAGNRPTSKYVTNLKAYWAGGSIFK